MKTFLLLLILFSFLQSAFLPVNLVLVILIARNLVLDSSDNLLIAFFAGLALSFLSQTNIGYWPLVLILVVKLSQALKKIPVSFNGLMVFLSGALLILIVSLFNQFFISQNLQISKLILESILVVPTFYLVRLWEERFVVKRGIKLKV